MHTTTLPENAKPGAAGTATGLELMIKDRTMKITAPNRRRKKRSRPPSSNWEIPPRDLVQAAGMFSTLGLDAHVVLLTRIAIDIPDELLAHIRYFQDRRNMESWRMQAIGIQALAARAQAKHDDMMREYYGAFELPPFPRRSLSVIEGGKPATSPRPKPCHRPGGDNGGRAA